MSAIEELAAERMRQVQIEGWTLEHDDEHADGALAAAAACHAATAAYLSRCFTQGYGPEWKVSNGPLTQAAWPFEPNAFKPVRLDQRRCALVKAGALIVAEIERLDRAEARADEEVLSDA